MKEQNKTIMPGVTLRVRNGHSSVRFSCMIDRKRFSTVSTLPLDTLITRSTLRPTVTLKAEYNLWVQKCKRELELGVDDDAVAARPRVQRRDCGCVAPTIEELLDTYEQIANERARNPNYRKPTPRSIETALKNVRYCVEESGLGMSRQYTELTNPDQIRRIFNSFCKRMNGVSAWSYIMSLKSITAKWARPIYRDMGYEVEEVELPDVGNIKKAPEYKELTGEQKEKIQAWYASLAGEKDRRLYLAASIVAQLAVRPCDVALLTAENFRKDADDDKHVHLRYRPRKTLESSNRRVDWPIRPALWDLIVEVAGERLRNGETLLAGPRSVFDRLNRSMREACGMKDWNKAVYELRKLCIDTVRREQGVDAAVALSGDRRETIDRYYSDPYKLNGIVPLEILPMK